MKKYHQLYTQIYEALSEIGGGEEREREKKKKGEFIGETVAPTLKAFHSSRLVSDWTNHANTRVGTHYGYTTHNES